MKERLTISGAHPVMRDHHVHGLPVLSGMAYIDLLYQVFRKHGHDFKMMVLRDLAIYRPLTTEDRDVIIDLRIEERPGRGWHIAVEESQGENGPAGAPILYATAEMHRVSMVAFDGERVELERIKEEAAGGSDVEGIYRDCREDGLLHREFMKVVGRAYETNTAAYVDCRLSSESLNGAQNAMFHPALMDGSAVCGGVTVARWRERGQRSLQLPLAYRSFRATSLIKDRSVVRIRRDTVRRKNDVSYFTMEFFDDEGRKVAELADLASKSVRDASSFGRRTHGVAATSGGQTSPGADAAETATVMSDLVRGIIAKHLRVPVEKIEDAFSFYDLGLDSVGLLRIVNEIGSEIQASLPPTLLFEYTTITELVAYLTKTYGGIEQTEALMKARSPGEARAAQAEDRTHEKVQARQSPQREPAEDTSESDIAIIALDGRYPGADTLDMLWDNLAQQKDCIVEVPGDRWSLEGFYEPDPERAIRDGKSYSKWGGFFASSQFVNPDGSQAPAGDPEMPSAQLETFVQLVGSLLGQANYAKNGKGRPFDNRVGVYLGVMPDGIGNAKPSELVNSISNAFSLQGPSVAIDTMSSSAMTAVHMACEALKRDECRAAVACGIYLLRRANFVYLSSHRVLGTHVDSRSFSEGDGLLLSEAMGAVLLKRLDNALKDNDKILAVIKSSTVNHAGNSKRELFRAARPDRDRSEEGRGRAEIDQLCGGKRQRLACRGCSGSRRPDEGVLGAGIASVLMRPRFGEIEYRACCGRIRNVAADESRAATAAPAFHSFDKGRRDKRKHPPERRSVRAATEHIGMETARH